MGMMSPGERLTNSPQADFGLRENGARIELRVLQRTGEHRCPGFMLACRRRGAVAGERRAHRTEQGVRQQPVDAPAAGGELHRKARDYQRFQGAAKLHQPRIRFLFHQFQFHRRHGSPGRGQIRREAAQHESEESLRGRRGRGLRIRVGAAGAAEEPIQQRQQQRRLDA